MNERDRVLQVMQSEGMNAKQFCQEVGISQGTLSNIMGGRNKPSLDVMQAILRRFRAVSCDWLIMGVGTMFVAGAREEGMLPLFGNENEPTTPSRKLDATPEVAGMGSGEMVADKSLSNHASNVSLSNPSLSAPVRTVSKIMVFYSDGTFEER